MPEKLVTFFERTQIGPVRRKRLCHKVFIRNTPKSWPRVTVTNDNGTVSTYELEINTPVRVETLQEAP